uniref:Uncharacterized protein n=1 Tax=Guillardia theta (strain CCMP2712) TaxID=905079 RepID=A0A0C3U6F6_GUITC
MICRKKTKEPRSQRPRNNRVLTRGPAVQQVLQDAPCRSRQGSGQEHDGAGGPRPEHPGAGPLVCDGHGSLRGSRGEAQGRPAVQQVLQDAPCRSRQGSGQEHDGAGGPRPEHPRAGPLVCDGHGSLRGSRGEAQGRPAVQQVLQDAPCRSRQGSGQEHDGAGGPRPEHPGAGPLVCDGHGSLRGSRGEAQGRPAVQQVLQDAPCRSRQGSGQEHDGAGGPRPEHPGAGPLVCDGHGSLRGSRGEAQGRPAVQQVLQDAPCRSRQGSGPEHDGAGGSCLFGLLKYGFALNQAVSSAGSRNFKLVFRHHLQHTSVYVC